ncbi:MAG: acyl carrier protein phosphodiesterase [Pseudarcicella sp.]|nr:acyl carrier protein phosphodiesterase [Pseudarcicella sp.]
MSADIAHLKIGNLIGDYVKGPLDGIKNKHIDEKIKHGLALHREIDFFTDTNSIVKQSIHRLQPKYHKFSGICVDMFYDHFLAKKFDEYSSIPLLEFSQNFYKFVEENHQILPEGIEKLVNSMIQRDWFTNYQYLENITWALKGIARQSTFESGIENAVEDLLLDYEMYEQEFDDFFPLLQQHCQLFIQKIEPKN